MLALPESGRLAVKDSLQLWHHEQGSRGSAAACMQKLTNAKPHPEVPGCGRRPSKRQGIAQIQASKALAGGGGGVQGHPIILRLVAGGNALHHICCTCKTLSC